MSNMDANSRAMSIEDILEEFRKAPGSFPRTALEAAVEQRETVTPHLLEMLGQDASDLERLWHDENYVGYVYAIYLLAYFREPKAYPVLYEFFSQPDNDEIDIADLTGDFVTEGLHRVLASVCGGDISYIKRLIEDPDVNVWVRSAAINALEVLVAEKELEPDSLLPYFRFLFTEGLQREPSEIWSSLVYSAVSLHLEELGDEIDKVFDEGLGDEYLISRSRARGVLARDKEKVQTEFFESYKNRTFIRHPVQELQGWAMFTPRSSIPQHEFTTVQTKSAPPPAKNKVGRNDPCPCGSGRKFKQCCGKKGNKPL